MNFVDTLLSNKKITLGGVDYDLLPLGDFFKLQRLREQIYTAFKKKDKKLFKEIITEVTRLQSRGNYKPEKFSDHLQSAYLSLSQNYIIADAAFLKSQHPENEKSTKKPVSLPWDYDGRTLAIWINSFAEHYHWSFKDILELPLNTAVYLYQEIAVSGQLQREWEYSITEMAYPYNESTKKNEFTPLKRPYWMTNRKDEKLIKVTKMRIDMLPYGAVVDLSGMGTLSQNEQSFNIPENQKQTEEDN